MKKILKNAYILFLAIILSGCRQTVSYNFMQDQSEINKIEIVKVGELDDKGINIQEVLCTVEDIESFLQDFGTVSCRNRVDAPRGVHPDQVVVKISYCNGEYELIGRGGQAYYTQQEQFINHEGLKSFDNEEFDDLIESYLRKGIK